MRGSDCLRHFGLLGWTRLFRECDHHQHALCQTVILLMNGYGKMPISVVILRSKFVTANFNSPNFYFSTAFVMVNSQKQNPLSMLRPVAPLPRCPQAPLPYDAPSSRHTSTSHPHPPAPTTSGNSPREHVGYSPPTPSNYGAQNSDQNTRRSV